MNRRARRACVGFLAVGVIFFLASSAPPLRAEDEPAHFPKWSWDTVPVYLHFGSPTQLTDQQVRQAAGLSRFICLEKGHGWRTDRDHPERLLVFNGLRSQNGAVDETTGGGVTFLPCADGVKIEHFDQFASSSKEDILLYWRMATDAARAGKMVIYKAWPDHHANFTNQEFMRKTPAEREQFARRRSAFPLACYLIGAQRHSYFCYGWGYDVADGQLVDYAEYRQRLGPPRGNAKRGEQRWVFTRDFEHASVMVDLEQREARITWSSGDVSTAAPDSPRATHRTNDWKALRRKVLELGDLTDAPQIHPAEGFAEEDGMRPIFYDALSWKGRPTRVFAWLGLPRTNQGSQAEGSIPGIVLVHGGGGTAFKEWVKKWNARGFAAISIAVEGQTDERDATGKGWKRHEWAGPARDGIYGDSDQPLSEQWIYHAAADTILANSLLRSLPQVDPEKVGIMGISWGGVITSTVVGIDRRFAFGIPTYGCGGLAEAANQYGRALGGNMLYREVWDPMNRMKNVEMPTLWLSWTGDQHFPLDALRNCYSTAPGSHMVAMLPNMRHGHAPGWNPPDSYAFAESVVRTGAPWCVQLGVKREGDDARISFTSTKPIQKATLVTTADRGFTGRRKWSESPAAVKQNDTRVIVNVTIPAGTTAWFVSVRSGGLVASSDLQVTGRRNGDGPK